ncbi:MAG: hypothetical protein WC554_14865, partial [Clostridia bacterium]
MTNFILATMGGLRYFLPLVKVLNVKKEKSCFHIIDSPRYSSPHFHLKHLNDLAKEFKFDIRQFNGNFNSDVWLSTEGIGFGNVKTASKKIVLTVMTDFTVFYSSYINNVDYVIFPSKFFAEYHKVVSCKNLYLGSPKYDFDLDNDIIRSKYKIVTNKNALVLFPRHRDFGNIDILNIYSCLRNMGYNVIVKTRGKDPVSKRFKGDQYFEDFTWFPHTTMELMRVSDFVINFDSTAIKECVMLDTPLINFHIKPFSRPMDFLYNYKYCKNMSNSYTKKDFEETVEYL